MDTLRSFAANHLVLFLLGLTVAWFVVVMVLTGIASSALRRPYGDPTTTAIGHLATAACVLLLAWRLGWLEASGVARLGSWQVWLLALGGVICFGSASLHAFYGRIAFDLTALARLPAARSAVLTNLAAALSEEVLFRGVALYALTRVWGHTRQGMIGSVLLTALIFALLHTTQVFTHGISPSSALLLMLETLAIATWWGAVALLGGSIWPAVMLHFVVNAAIAVQGLTVPMVEPNILAYRRLLWFSIMLGALGIGLLVRAAPRATMPEAP